MSRNKENEQQHIEEKKQEEQSPSSIKEKPTSREEEKPTKENKPTSNSNSSSRITYFISINPSLKSPSPPTNVNENAVNPSETNLSVPKRSPRNSFVLPRKSTNLEQKPKQFLEDIRTIDPKNKSAQRMSAILNLEKERALRPNKTRLTQNNEIEGALTQMLRKQHRQTMNVEGGGG